MKSAVPSSQHRDSSIRWAVITSVISKCGTLVLRLVSIPVAIRMLGMEEFGVYATITTAVGMLDVLHVGLGPALTQAISRAVAQGDRKREVEVFVTALLLSAGLTAVIAAVLALLVGLVPVESLFGAKYAAFAGIMRRVCWIAIGVIAVQLICQVCEKARDGYLETRYNNAWGAGGNFVGAVALLAGIWWCPTIEFLLLAVNGSVAMAKLGNSLHLLWQRPWIVPRRKHFRPHLVPSLLTEGLRFSATYLVSALVEYNILVYLAGRFCGPGVAALFSVMVTIHFSLNGFVQMFTIPLWPALVNANAAGETDWIRASARKLYRYSTLYTLSVLCGLVAVGPWVLGIWLGDEAPLIGRLDLAAFGLYFALHIWRQVNQVLLLGIGQINSCAWVVLAEAGLVLAGLWITLHGSVVWVVYGVMSLTIASVTGWIYPLLFRRKTGYGLPNAEGGLASL